MNKNLIYLLISLIVVLLTGIITYLQSDRKRKLIAALIMLWAIATAYKEYNNYIISISKPSLVLTAIDQEYDAKPSPSSGLFFLNLKNIGGATAIKIQTHQIFSVNNTKIHEKRIEQADIEAGVTRKIRFNLEGETFRKIWNEQVEFQLRFDIVYKDSSNTEYKNRYKLKYCPHPDQTVFHPTWEILKLPSEDTSSR